VAGPGGVVVWGGARARPPLYHFVFASPFASASASLPLPISPLPCSLARALALGSSQLSVFAFFFPRTSTWKRLPLLKTGLT
jgi:hypothetical protein